MLSREEARAVYNASRRWDYWTDSLMGNCEGYGIDGNECWKDAVNRIERAVTSGGENIEDYAVEVIETLSKLGVNDRRMLAKATLDWAFMTRFRGNGKGSRNEAYKQCISCDTIGEDGLRELADFYWDDCETGYPVL